MTATAHDLLIARNPATGAEIGRVPATPAGEVVEAVARARRAQAAWAEKPWRERQGFLKRWWSILARDADAWVNAIREEVGKPRVEALAGDVVGTLDLIRLTVCHGGRSLAGSTLGPGHQRLLQIPAGKMTFRPLGVIGMLGTWNYPLLMNAPPIAHALAAGNAVVWKPSEFAPLAGVRLRESLEAADMPEGLVATVLGGAEAGTALVEAEIDKGFFTGGVENGRRVLAGLAARGVPALAELSGFDPAVVLPDAPFEATVRALTWASFVGAGQTCVGVKRVLVVGDPKPWADALAAAARALRIGDPARDDVDVGPLISEAARDQVHRTVRAAVAAGADVLAGGALLDGPGWFYPPTVLCASAPEPEEALEGVFGPVVLVRGVPDADSAVTAANASRCGLAASVWSRDTRAARALAGRIDAGMVTVNEAVTPTLHASAPFGGTRASGFGRTHGAIGLREFTQPHVVFTRSAGGFRPHLFPYGRTGLASWLGLYRGLFH
jgi:acyl-CoA reductase-like NAD-dependent aldehyde dehydrogenase